MADSEVVNSVNGAFLHKRQTFPRVFCNSEEKCFLFTVVIGSTRFKFLS